MDPGRMYFAYGSNMDPDQMAFRGLEVLRAEAAVLPGRRLDFNFDAGSRWLGGAADIVAEEGSSVEGVLYELGTDIEAMDPWEGVPTGYRRMVVEVELVSSGETVPAWTYEVVSKGRYIPPSEGYIGKMILAARRFGLSPGYQRSLRLHLACGLRELGDHLSVLEALLEGEGAMTAGELGTATSMPPGRLDGALEDLTRWGWVTGPGDRLDYRLLPARREDTARMLRLR